MLFNSAVFLKFFAAFLLLYWLVRNHLRARNLLIVAASLLFYGWWDWRFLGLLLATSALDFGVGIALDKASLPGRRKWILALSIVANLLTLGFFKYYDFFVTSMARLFLELNIPFRVETLGIILPVGISFYTFQSMSYAIDVYRRDLPATRSFVNFLAYVSFFPQLVAGPIERASHLLPQFERPRVITRPMLEEGLWLMAQGMFKKVALSDNFAPLVEMVFDHPGAAGPAVALATVAFGLQIYCDFSGYSDLARGLARVLGFDIMVNFNVPYAAGNVREFWRRWHISLSTWLRDYLYVPLGGNRLGPARTGLNLMLTMFLGGLWHGAAWNFVLWGLWHGAGLLAHRFAGGKAGSRQAGPAILRAAGWLGTMLFVFYGWLLFRAKSMESVVALTRGLGDWTAPAWIGSHLLNLLVFAAPLVCLDRWQAKHGTAGPFRERPVIRAAALGAMLLGILFFWEKEAVQFIYFQF